MANDSIKSIDQTRTNPRCKIFYLPVVLQLELTVVGLPQNFLVTIPRSELPRNESRLQLVDRAPLLLLPVFVVSVDVCHCSLKKDIM